MDISDKAKVIYATMEKLGAVDNENKITSYAILDYIIEESEELQEHELLKDIPEDEYTNITLEITLKGVNTLITSLAKKDLVVKTEPVSLTVDGTTRSLRQYYLKK
jgi:hypothetical protein